MKKNLLLKLGTTTVFTLPVITFDSCSDSNNKQTNSNNWWNSQNYWTREEVLAKNYTEAMIQEYIFINLIFPEISQKHLQKKILFYQA